MPVEQSVVCPRDPRWLRRMLEVLPPGLRGRLEPFEQCLMSPSVVQSGGPERRRNVIYPVIR